jgi:hypothetical protein
MTTWKNDAVSIVTIWMGAENSQKYSYLRRQNFPTDGNDPIET